MNDEALIRRTFELALKGLGTTWPNPLVGAVIVKNGKVIGEGFHRKQGEAHAEIEAIKNAHEDVRGSTIYVNLEPCCHTNKTTPPCAQRLIQEGFKKVVICNLDPNSEVNGKGIELLRKNGIEVQHGLLAEEGEKINEVFFLSQRLKRPFIHFKSAVTLDGKTAMLDGKSQWITGEKARNHVHHLRSQHQGIIVGSETVRKDNPRLTVRIPGHQGGQPYRIVITKSGQLPSENLLFNDEFKHLTLIYTMSDLSFPFPKDQVIKFNELGEILSDLFKRKIINLFLESGSTLASAFLKEGFIDRISLYQSTSFLGQGRDLFSDLNLKNLNYRPHLFQIESKWFDSDHYLTGRLKCSQD